MGVGFILKPIESHTNYETYKASLTFPTTEVNSWVNMQKGTYEALSQGSQPNERVMSLPKHAVKLPY